MLMIYTLNDLHHINECVSRLMVGQAQVHITLIASLEPHQKFISAKMKFENLLAEVGGFGKYQISIIALLVIPRVTLPFHFLLNNFIAAIPSHHCDISSLDADGILGNLSREERLIVSIPAQEDGTPASCHMFTYPQFHLLMNSSSSTELPVVECQNGWEFDNGTFKSALATEVIHFICFLFKCILYSNYSIL